jgi:hypothetical protein
MRNLISKQLAFIILTLVVTASAAFAQTSSFTYQGRLTDNGVAATGAYDLQFALYSTVNGGGQIGQTVTMPNVSVTGGVFTVTLDFGANSFPGAGRFLEISTRQSGVGALTLLNPRQPITATPNALRSLNSKNADTATNAQQLGGTSASQFVKTDDPRLTDARPPAAGSINYVANSSNLQNAQFNISGNGTVLGQLTGNIVNSNLQYTLAGQRIAARVGSNGLLLGAPNAPIALGENANVGIGTENPSTALANGRVLDIEGQHAALRLGATSGRFEWQATQLGSSGAMNLANVSSGTNLFTVLNNGNVGVNQTAPTASLHVNGNVKISSLGSGGSTQLCLNAASEVSNCSSSLKYKSDFHPFAGGMNVVNRLRPLTFKWKDNAKLDLGLGAEDVAEVEPLLVVRNDQGDVEGVKYDRLSAVFINAFKEQQAEITSLRTANAELNKRLQSIEGQLKRQSSRRK